MNTEGPPGSVPLAKPQALENTGSLYERVYAIRGDYQRADTPKTLREGLTEYYDVNPGLIDPATMDHEFAAHYFHCHDTTHVIFGTHAGPLDEGVNDLFTMFGVAVSYPQYIKGFLKTSAAGIVATEYKKFPTSTVLRSVFGTIRLMPRVWRSCRAMKKKWPWDPPPDALDRPLIDLREEHGIEVWRPELILNVPRNA